MRLSNSHWAELKQLEDPSLIILTECADYGRIPGWVTNSLPPHLGVGISVSMGSLQIMDSSDLVDCKTRVCEWSLGSDLRIVVAGVHVHKNYGRIAEVCLRSMRNKVCTQPTIVAGDFNVNADYSVSEFKRFDRARIEAGLRSCWHESLNKPFGNEPPTWRNFYKNGVQRQRKGCAPDNAFMIDYLLVSPHFAIVKADVAEMEHPSSVKERRWDNSDHKAVWADLSLP